MIWHVISSLQAKGGEEWVETKHEEEIAEEGELPEFTKSFIEPRFVLSIFRVILLLWCKG